VFRSGNRFAVQLPEAFGLAPGASVTFGVAKEDAGCIGAAACRDRDIPGLRLKVWPAPQ
jgi:hypothetical protein